MAEFKTIETQEELNNIISERLKRERESTTKEFTEKLETLQAENEKLKGLEKEKNDIGKTLEEAKKTLEENKKTIEGLNSQVKEYETNSVKMRVASEMGLSLGLANRLTGDDEAAIREDAENMKALIDSQHTPPLKSTEAETAGANEAYMGMLDSLRN